MPEVLMKEGLDSLVSNVKRELGGKADAFDVLPVAKGGTGASTAAQAVTSIGAAPAVHTNTVGQVVVNAGENWAGSIPPVYMPLFSVSCGDKLRFTPPENIDMEYSTDGGETWNDKGEALNIKRMITDGRCAHYVTLAPTGINVTTDLQARYTFWARDRYAGINKAFIWFSTMKHKTVCDIYTSTKGEPDNWALVRGNVQLKGWSGPNVIELFYNYSTYGGTDNQLANNGAIRFVFRVIEVAEDYVGTPPQVAGIGLYGPSVWGVANEMMRSGHLYSWDAEQNASFPNEVTAKFFNGTSASSNKLSVSAGSATRPVYFSNGIPVECDTAEGYDLPQASTDTLGGVKISTADVSTGENPNHMFSSTLPTLLDANGRLRAASPSTVSDDYSGLMTPQDKKKLDGIATGANNYVLPTATPTDIGGVKVSFAEGGSISQNTSEGTYLPSKILPDGTLAVRANNTATGTYNGLMSATDKTKLDNIETGANNYQLPIAANGTLGGFKPNTIRESNVGTIRVDSTGIGWVEPATTEYPGVVKPGEGLTVGDAGIMSVDNVDVSKLSGVIEASHLPSYVDDVIESATVSEFPATGEAGKIYVATSTNLTYRWSGSGYVEISPSIALGETGSTAYRGDRGAAAYAHATAKGSAFASGLYKITTNAEGHVTAATAVEKSDIVSLGIPASDTTYDIMTPATTSAAGSVGLVPAPAAGDNERYLRGDGTWQAVSANPETITASELDTMWEETSADG